MPTTLPPRNDDARDGASQSPAPLLPDESALRRVFDAEFPTLYADASRELGPAAAQAPKVVECAFVHAWEQRTRFAATAGLQAFLRDDVHHGVARALSRRAAAHRLGHHDEAQAAHAHDHVTAASTNSSATALASMASAPPMDLEMSWRHVLDTLHDQGPTLAARAHAVEVSRHDAAQHVAAIGKEGSWVGPVIIGAVGLGAIAAAMLWANRASEQSVITRALAAPDTRVVSSNSGQMANVTLGEGTRVRLAPDTRVTIPKGFGERMRAVRLNGAATFEPRTGLAAPMQVHAGNTVVVATGTSFSVRSWDGDGSVAVQVHTGSVAVRAGTTERALAAGQALLVMPDGAMREPDAEQLKAAMGWTSGRVVLAKQPLTDALVQMRRFYGLQIGLADSAIGTRSVSVDAPLDAPKEAIAAIEAQAGVKYSYAGRDLVFRDTTAKK